MGRDSRKKPARLAEKFSQLRNELGLSQNEMIVHLGLSEELVRQDISDFERGVREPDLMTLLKYARSVGILVEILIDDELDLPSKLSTNKHSSVSPTKSPSKRR